MEEITAVHIVVDAGVLNVESTAQQALEISGTVNDPDRVSYNFDQSTGEVIVVFDYEGDALRPITPPPLDAHIAVPPGITLTIESQGAAVQLQDFSGMANVSSVSGDITALRIGGAIKLYSNRGNIAVQESRGSLGVVSNYGLVTLTDVRGDVSASNIIGNILLATLIGAEDTVSLENDHGDVEISLAQGASLSVSARSNSGDVTCLPPSLTVQARECGGTLGEGEGTLAIRTVSGQIRLEEAASP